MVFFNTKVDCQASPQYHQEISFLISDDISKVLYNKTLSELLMEWIKHCISHIIFQRTSNTFDCFVSAQMEWNWSMCSTPEKMKNRVPFPFFTSSQNMFQVFDGIVHEYF